MEFISATCFCLFVVYSKIISCRKIEKTGKILYHYLNHGGRRESDNERFFETVFSDFYGNVAGRGMCTAEGNGKCNERIGRAGKSYAVRQLQHVFGRRPESSETERQCRADDFLLFAGRTYAGVSVRTSVRNGRPL